MSWAERATEIIEAGDPENPHLGMDVRQAAALTLLNERIRSEVVRGKVWGAMKYQCESCRLIQWYELEVGVEGPPDWRKDRTYLACAFTAGRCRCGGTFTHVDFKGDLVYDELRDPGEKIERQGNLPTQASHVFRVPTEPVIHVTHLDAEGRPQYTPSCQGYLQMLIR